MFWVRMDIFVCVGRARGRSPEYKYINKNEFLISGKIRAAFKTKINNRELLKYVQVKI